MLSVRDDACSSLSRGRGDMTLCPKGAPLSVPNDTAYATRIASGSTVLDACGGHADARDSCRSGTTAYDHWLADIGHKF